MAAITNYTTLAAAIDDWDERDNDADELIGLAEAEFRLYLGPNYARETTTTVAFTSGSGTLPTGFIRPIALIHSIYGEVVLRSIVEVKERRVWDTSGIPGIYAVTGSTLETAPIYTGNLSFVHEASLTGLSGSNATNWLITAAPQAYLSMCLSFAKAKNEDYAGAELLRSTALRTLADLGFQSMVASQRGFRIRGAVA